MVGVVYTDECPVIGVELQGRKGVTVAREGCDTLVAGSVVGAEENLVLANATLQMRIAAPTEGHRLVAGINLVCA